MPKIDETFLYGAFTTMASKRNASAITTLGEALNDYKHLRLAGMVKFDCEYRKAILKYATREYLTASKNHIILNLVKRIERAFNTSSAP
jgi:hypothetical protein